MARRRLARARSLRHVRHHVPRPPRPAAHPDVGHVRRGVPAAEGLPAARPVQPGGAGAPGARRESGSALLDGRVVDRAGLRRAASRHAGAAAPGRARQDPLLGMSKRTVDLELATPGLDAQGRPARIPLTVAGGEVERQHEPTLDGEHMLMNIGPQHPATHGVLRLVVELDGETVVRVIPHLGYLHSGFEKLGEYRHYNQIIPLTDRTDYLSPMANTVGFALAAAQLMGIALTPRCTALRVLTAAEAINHSLSGPMLRASGVAYDVRKDKPYLDYETYDFDVVVGEHGDVYDRYLVRLEECSQSNRILQQALDRLPDGPINIADPRVILPPKSRAMNDME